MNLDDYLSKKGAANRLARLICVNPVLISQWRSFVRPVPISRCVLIEKATGGKVTRKDLRPEDWQIIWPELVNNDKQEVA